MRIDIYHTDNRPWSYDAFSTNHELYTLWKKIPWKKYNWILNFNTLDFMNKPDQNQPKMKSMINYNNQICSSIDFSFLSNKIQKFQY